MTRSHTVQALAPEILRPVGVLIVDDKQSEAAVFVESLNTRHCRRSRPNQIGALIASRTSQALNSLQQTFPGLCWARWCRRS